MKKENNGSSTVAKKHRKLFLLSYINNTEMNKELLYATMVAIILSVMAAGCVDNSLEQDVESQYTDGRIAFKQKIGNMTRGTTQAQDAGHYEFGVFAMKADALADFDASTNGVMDNYLVAYTNGTTSGINNWYQTVKTTATTWGNAASGNLTDAATGVSSWFYEDITSTNHATYTTPEVNQILKYWDRGVANHYFFAYMPYNKKTTTTTYNADKIAFSYDNTAGAKFVYTNLSSFYTSPVTGKQVATAAAKTVTSPGDKSYTDNNEILNDNEALYAYKSVAKAHYGEDVPLEFKHVNAKVNIAFYETIDGYKVRLIDVVPEKTFAPGSDFETPVYKYLTAAKGIQFSPSTDIQAQQPMTVPQTIDLPTYYEAADVTASHVETGTATLALTGTAVNDNLVFEATNATGTALPITGETQYIGEGNAANKTLSATTLYVLPNHDGTNYITAADSKEYATHGSMPTGGGTTANIADKTGYTLHVSYEILPEDGTPKTTVYDARVHVDAQYCKWQAGKAYTYIFRITNMSNGTTDPTAVDPAAGGTTPWVDERDPRVPDEPALIPIIFDGVVVTDYDDYDIADVIDREWKLTQPATWSTIGSTANHYSPQSMTSADLATALGTDWTTASAGIIAGSCTYDKDTHVFTMNDGTNTFKWKATNQAVSSAPFVPKYNGAEITDAVVPAPAMYSYSLYVWENDAASSATRYTVEPTGEVVYTTRTQVDQMMDSSSHILYKKTVAENGGAPTVAWYTDAACTSAYSGDTSAYTTTVTTTITYSGPSITFGTVTATPGITTAVKAYAILRHV